MNPDSCRLDRWLWAVRVYKTRSLAKDACLKGAIRVNGSTAKPAARIKSGDQISVKGRERTRELEVAAVLEKRVGPALASNYFVDHTPPSHKESGIGPSVSLPQRDRGAGRPTKRDRRLIDKLRRG